jgi:hypothetical protein
MARAWSVLVGAMLVLGSGGVVFAEPIDDTPGATVFLNSSGGVYRPGFDNALTNTSPIISGVRAVPPFAGNDEDWRAIVDRVRARFAPFDISIVDVEPVPPLRYIEAVAGGTPAMLGFSSDVLGVSPVYCRPAATSIVFVFAGTPSRWITRSCARVRWGMWRAAGRRSSSLGRPRAASSPSGRVSAGLPIRMPSTS